jgi:hypothetical protein
MAMSFEEANIKLDEDMKDGSPHLMLHTGDPGNDGDDNEALLGTADVARKAATMGTAVASTTATEQISKNTAAVEWAGTEITSAQSLTHFSIWDATTTGNVLYIATIETSKTTGSDGVTVGTSDLEVAISVYKTG